MTNPWRLAHDSRLIWHCMDAEHLVFDELSGSTHLLDRFAAQALQALSTNPQSTDQLCRQLSADMDHPPPEQLHDRLEETLQQLRRAGLAQQINP